MYSILKTVYNIESLIKPTTYKDCTADQLFTQLLTIIRLRLTNYWFAYIYLHIWYNGANLRIVFEIFNVLNHFINKLYDCHVPRTILLCIYKILYLSVTSYGNNLKSSKIWFIFWTLQILVERMSDNVSIRYSILLRTWVKKVQAAGVNLETSFYWK